MTYQTEFPDYTDALPALPAGFVDSRSSAVWFDGWSRPRELAFVGERRERDRDPPVVGPRTWLLRVGWKQDGPMDLDALPSEATSARNS